jgi:hypothetical protein
MLSGSKRKQQVTPLADPERERRQTLGMLVSEFRPAAFSPSRLTALTHSPMRQRERKIERRSLVTVANPLSIYAQ